MTAQVLYLPADNPINRLPEALKQKLVRAQGNAVDKEFNSAGALAERVLHDTRINLNLPQALYQESNLRCDPAKG